MIPFLAPVEHFGRKFDRAMTLFEFSALREPEATRFPQIGAWLMSRGVLFNEVPMPQMLWHRDLYPDLYIANQLDALRDTEIGLPSPPACFSASEKRTWADDLTLDNASRLLHGEQFHETFIEPFCRKISGRSSAEIAAKYHRALWLPLYWPQTLRARKSLPTKFYYPRDGYAGAIRSCLSGSEQPHTESARDIPDADMVSINMAYIIAQPRAAFSVCFVVDPSPIYRVTNMDACAGLEPEFHRFIVEYRGECLVAQELERLGLTYHPRHMAFGALRMELPTIENVKRGWKPRPHINDRLWSLMHDAKASA